MTLTEIKSAVYFNDPIGVHIVDLQVGLHDLCLTLERLRVDVACGEATANSIVGRLTRLIESDIG
jgi:hypothetical protein